MFLHLFSNMKYETQMTNHVSESNNTMLSHRYYNCSAAYMNPWATIIAMTGFYILGLLWFCKSRLEFSSNFCRYILLSLGGKTACLPVPDSIFPYQKRLRQLERDLLYLTVDDVNIEITETALGQGHIGFVFKGKDLFELVNLPFFRIRFTENWKSFQTESLLRCKDELPDSIKVDHFVGRSSENGSVGSSKYRQNHRGFEVVVFGFKFSLSKFRRTLQISTSAINCHGMVAWRILVRIFSTLYSGLVNRKMTNLATPLQEREERERPTIKLREILHILSQVEFLLDLKFILV